ncbi:MAG: hypothetical protein V4493_01205 [Pseudomonadota bacterium]
MVNRYQQPQGGPTGINFSNPITKGLACVYNAGNGFIDLIKVKAGGNRGGISLAPNKIGLGYVSTGNIAIGARFDGSSMRTSNGAGTGDFSVLIIANPIASSTREIMLTIGDGSQEFYFAVNAAVGLSASSGAVSPQTNTGAASGVSASGAADGAMHAYLYVRSGTIGYLYSDGKLLATNSVLAAVMWSPSSVDFVGGYWQQNWGISNHIAMVVGWNRALNIDESTNITRSLQAPWQVFSSTKTLIFNQTVSQATGDLIATESSSDTSSIIGKLISSGTIAKSESTSDTSTLLANTKITSSVSVIENENDSPILSGKVKATGTSSHTETLSDTAQILGAQTPVLGYIAGLESVLDNVVIPSKNIIDGYLNYTETSSDRAHITAPGLTKLEGNIIASLISNNYRLELVTNRYLLSNNTLKIKTEVTP